MFFPSAAEEDIPPASFNGSGRKTAPQFNNGFFGFGATEGSQDQTFGLFRK